MSVSKWRRSTGGSTSVTCLSHLGAMRSVACQLSRQKLPDFLGRNLPKTLPGISGFSLILRRVILARKASVVSEYKLTVAASVALELAGTLEASLLSKHLA